MPVTPFLDSPAVREMVRKVVEYASAPEHWYRVRADGTTDQVAPGEIPEHVCSIPMNFRCVFSVTAVEDKLYRHLSVSIPGTRRLPHPLVIEAIAEMFGFTADGWEIQVDEADPCIIVLQPLLWTVV